MTRLRGSSGFRAALQYGPTALVLGGLGSILLGALCGCGTTAPEVSYRAYELGVITDVQPLAVQPDLAKWRALEVDMTETDVTALLGQPYRKDPRPVGPVTPGLRRLYTWDYGEVAFRSFTTKGTFSYSVIFHDGRVNEITDPWNGRFSPDGHPTLPDLVLPSAGETLDHYPRFLDFRWLPCSGAYPVEYEVTIQALSIGQDEAEHFEDYVRNTVDSDRASKQAAGISRREMDERAESFAGLLRRDQGVVDIYRFQTHDIYLPFTWVGANTGRWQVRAVNNLGTSDWTPWRYFKFSK